MIDPIRISPKEARKKIQSGDALFVCAYDSDEKFNSMHLDGAISFKEFSGQSGSLPKDQQIIFYCA